MHSQGDETVILGRDEKPFEVQRKTKAYLQKAHFPSTASIHTGFIFSKVALLKLPIDLEKHNHCLG